MNFALNASLFLIETVTIGGIILVSILAVFGIVGFIIDGVFKRRIKKMQEDKNKEQNESYHERADKENRTNFEEAYIRTYRNEFLDELKARLKCNGAKYIEQFNAGVDGADYIETYYTYKEWDVMVYLKEDKIECLITALNGDEDTENANAILEKYAQEIDFVSQNYQTYDEYLDAVTQFILQINADIDEIKKRNEEEGVFSELNAKNLVGLRKRHRYFVIVFSLFAVLCGFMACVCVWGLTESIFAVIFLILFGAITVLCIVTVITHIKKMAGCNKDAKEKLTYEVEGTPRKISFIGETDRSGFYTLYYVKFHFDECKAVVFLDAHVDQKNRKKLKKYKEELRGKRFSFTCLKHSHLVLDGADNIRKRIFKL